MLNWSAFMIQHPEKQAEVALVIKGQKGTGKGTFFRALYKLAGRHGMHISNQQHFTNGNGVTINSTFSPDPSFHQVNEVPQP